MNEEDYRNSASALGQILDGAVNRHKDESFRADRRMRIEKICSEAVHYRVNVQLGVEDRKHPIGRSLYSFLLWEMARAASDYASANDVDPDDFEIIELDKALAVVENVRSALVREWSDRTLDFFDSVSSPLEKIKSNKAPYFDRSSLESVVGDYLALPYRSASMDRFLVRVLVAMELYAFGDEMLNEKTFGLYPARSPLKQRHVLLAYLRGQTVNAVFFGGIAALAIWASSKGWIFESTAAWISVTCVSLFLVFGGVATLILPFAWHKQVKARRLVAKLLSAMIAIYNELKSDGPISAHFIRERATAASVDGVGWPSPLFALLDDIIKRTGRF